LSEDARSEKVASFYRLPFWVLTDRRTNAKPITLCKDDMREWVSVEYGLTSLCIHLSFLMKQTKRM